jgi:hypothetical protein
MAELPDDHSVEAFLHRFGGFFDALIVEIRLLLPRTSAQRHAIVRLLAEERADAGEASVWRSVVLTVNGLTEFKLCEGPASYLVLSDGLRIHFLRGPRCLVDLAPVTDVDVPAEVSLKRSPHHLVGSVCSYEVDDAIE